MDLFQVLRNLSSVEKVSGIYSELPQSWVFFLCPDISGKGIYLNKFGTGFTIQYRAGLSRSSAERLERARRFASEAAQAGIEVRLTAVFASADALMLFPVPLATPEVPEIEGVRVISNYSLVHKEFARWGELYQSEPWQRVRQKVRKEEEERLRGFLPKKAPEHLCKDFVRRVFAGFALDGLLLRNGAFGTQPVLLGVESSGVTVLQNAALAKGDRIPVIQLK